MTEPGGPAWRQTMFLPFAATSRHARGIAAPGVSSDTYETADTGRSRSSTPPRRTTRPTRRPLFPVNRAISEATGLTVQLPAGDYDVAVHTLHDEDPFAANTLAEPDRVRPEVNTTARLDRCAAHRRAPARLLGA